MYGLIIKKIGRALILYIKKNPKKIDTDELFEITSKTITLLNSLEEKDFNIVIITLESINFLFDSESVVYSTVNNAINEIQKSIEINKKQAMLNEYNLNLLGK